MKSDRLRLLLCCLAAPLAAVGGYFCTGALVNLYLERVGGEASLLALYLFNALEQLVCFALPAALILSARPGRWRRALAGEENVSFRSFSLTALLAVSATVTVTMIAVLWQGLTGLSSPHSPLPDPQNAGEWALAMLAVAMIPALCEELLFRCVLQRALCHRLPRAGVWIAALLFAALHRQWDALPALLLLGLTLGWLYRRYGFGGSALLHLLYNAVVLTLSSLDAGVTPLAAALSGFLFVLALRGLLKKEEAKNEADGIGL
ncbi:MAG: CPBP family intramembrane metalloprotease [Clostridia bacterium]|nr:CPBP family intramembrane metalloprotease [Clostridia bacterium]